MLDKLEVASAYVDFMRGDSDRLLALVDDDFFDNVSGQRGPGIWRTVTDWLTASFTDVDVELHSVAEEDDGRVLTWITLHGTHIGSAFPFMAGQHDPTAEDHLRTHLDSGEELLWSPGPQCPRTARTRWPPRRPRMATASRRGPAAGGRWHSP